MIEVSYSQSGKALALAPGCLVSGFDFGQALANQGLQVKSVLHQFL